MAIANCSSLIQNQSQFCYTGSVAYWQNLADADTSFDMRCGPDCSAVAGETPFPKVRTPPKDRPYGGVPAIAMAVFTPRAAEKENTVRPHPALFQREHGCILLKKVVFQGESAGRQSGKASDDTAYCCTDTI